MAQACPNGDPETCGTADLNVRATIINLTLMPFDEAIEYCYDHMMQCPNICEKAIYEDQEYACQQFYLCCEYVPPEAQGNLQGGFIVIE